MQYDFYFLFFHGIADDRRGSRDHRDNRDRRDHHNNRDQRDYRDSHRYVIFHQMLLESIVFCSMSSLKRHRMELHSSQTFRFIFAIEMIVTKVVNISTEIAITFAAISLIDLYKEINKIAVHLQIGTIDRYDVETTERKETRTLKIVCLNTQKTLNR